MESHHDHAVFTAQYGGYKEKLEFFPAFNSLLPFFSHDSSLEEPISSTTACQEMSLFNIIFIKLGLSVTEVWVSLYCNSMFLLVCCDSYMTTKNMCYYWTRQVLKIQWVWCANWGSDSKGKITALLENWPALTLENRTYSEDFCRGEVHASVSADVLLDNIVDSRNKHISTNVCCQLLVTVLL